MSRIVSYDPKYRTALLSLSVRAWEHVFPLLQRDVPAFVYNAFYPTGWRERHVNDLAEVLDNASECIDVALDGDRPTGWVCTRFHPEDNMSEIYIIAVDPDYQRSGVGAALMESSFARAREKGMGMAMVETGGDRGHAPARMAYESMGFVRWPIARYFKDLGN